MTSDPKGLDLAALQDWLERERPELVTGPLTASLITGGKSNLTYTLSAGSRDYVVRRPPLGHVLATAHDMGREYRVMAALAPTNVPVPQMIAHCEDTEVIGAPFYVMEKVAGTPYGRASQLEPLGPERTRAITERMVDTLVALHAVDYAAVGLGDFGRPRRLPRTPGRPLEEAAGGIDQPRAAGHGRARRPPRVERPRQRRRARSCTATSGSTTCSSTPMTRSRRCSTGR